MPGKIGVVHRYDIILQLGVTVKLMYYLDFTSKFKQKSIVGATYKKDLVQQSNIVLVRETTKKKKRKQKSFKTYTGHTHSRVVLHM